MPRKSLTGTAANKISGTRRYQLTEQHPGERASERTLSAPGRQAPNRQARPTPATPSGRRRNSSPSPQDGTDQRQPVQEARPRPNPLTDSTTDRHQRHSGPTPASATSMVPAPRHCSPSSTATSGSAGGADEAGSGTARHHSTCRARRNAERNRAGSAASRRRPGTERKNRRLSRPFPAVHPTADHICSSPAQSRPAPRRPRRSRAALVPCSLQSRPPVAQRIWPVHATARRRARPGPPGRHPARVQVAMSQATVER